MIKVFLLLLSISTFSINAFARIDAPGTIYLTDCDTFVDSNLDGASDVARDCGKPPSSIVIAAINPSRTTCASPCTVVFSAENTTAVGLDEHGVWSQLAYYWDFDTDETDTYGSLYNQTYTYVAGDTAREIGHVPMATKTFLCATGTCAYNVGMRAQNATGDWGDTFQTITVTSESAQWNAANTVCISNTLSTGADWTVYDKPCPAGATKQSVMPDYDQYNGKLILMRRGDTFTQDFATLPNQSNFKIGVFGNVADGRPYLSGEFQLGNTNFSGPANAPTSANVLNISDALVATYGWPYNIYFEGLGIAEVAFPMSYQHIGLHDIDMDRRAYATGGRIDVSEGSTTCHSNANLDCANVPFPKGGYISSVNVVGESLSTNGGPTVQIVQTACPMVNFLGVVDISVQRAREHNLRIAGWYRINIMRSIFRGEHELPGKQKITLRSCLKSGGAWETEVWATAPDLPPNWDLDVEGRTRADADSVGATSTEFAHTSRYQVVSYNQIGDNSATVGTVIGGVQYQTNASYSFPLDLQLYKDVMVSHNIFETEPGKISTQDMALQSSYGTCVANTYSQPGILCAPSVGIPEANFRREPTVITAPLAPGSN